MFFRVFAFKLIESVNYIQIIFTLRQWYAVFTLMCVGLLS